MARVLQQLHGPITVAQQEDDTLRRLAIRYRRDLEDIASGDSAKPARMVQTYLNDVEGEQELRAALAETWMACDRGIDGYSDWMRAGGLSAAMVCVDRPRPSYRLAEWLDWWMFHTRRPHALAWDGEPMTEEECAKGRVALSGQCARCGHDHAEDIAMGAAA